MDLTLVIAILALAVCVWLLYQVVGQNGRILLRLETLEARPKPSESNGKPNSLPIGAVLHDFELPLLTGSSMTLSEWRGRRFLLIFADPACAYCQSLASRLPATPAIPTLIVSTGDWERNRALFAAQSMTGPALLHVLLQEGAEVADLYGIAVTPSGYLVGEQGSTAQELLVGAESLLAVMKNGVAENGTTPWKTAGASVASQLTATELKTGSSAPDFTLPRVDGGELSLSAFSGQSVLLVFSDAGCAPCLSLAPKLERIHRGSSGLRVLMISRGDLQANCDMVMKLNLTFPVALQRHWEISRLYGKVGTPVGFVIGSDGRLTAELAIGEPGILGLVSSMKEEENAVEQTIR